MRGALLLLLVGCVDPIDARWQLDHDHVVAVRTSPPAVMPGERAKIDALIARSGAPVLVGAPSAATAGVSEDDPLHGLVTFSLREAAWFVHAPGEETLAAVRARDGLAADAPVPLPIVMAFDAGGEKLYATKTILLGARGENPSIPAMAIDGEPAADRLQIPIEQDVYVSVNVEPGARVNWLTSCGTLYQDDVATAFLRVQPDDETAGELAVVIRDARGGVAWRVWPVIATR